MSQALGPVCDPDEHGSSRFVSSLSSVHQSTPGSVCQDGNLWHQMLSNAVARWQLTYRWTIAHERVRTDYAFQCCLLT